MHTPAFSGGTSLKGPINEQSVMAFLEVFERAQGTQDFEQVAPLIHPDALFRFNDGDYRGLEAIEKAFEATWAYDVENELYRVEDIRVEHSDAASAAATFGFLWSGDGPQGHFEVTGRGTTVIVEHEGSLKVSVEHLSR